MNIAQHIERGGALFPQKAALVYEGMPFTYGGLNLAANRIANGLRRLGIGKGDRVALLLPNRPEMVQAYLGALKVGAIAVSINPSLKADEIEFILNDCQAKLAFVTAAQRESCAAVTASALQHWVSIDDRSGVGLSLDELLGAPPEGCAEPMQGDEPAVIVYTSGTTGFPKGAVLSHGNVISNVRAKQRYLGISPEDRLLLFLPLFHCFGQNAVLNSGLYAGATVILQNHFDPEKALAAIAEQRVSMFFGVPTTYILLVDRATPRDLSGIRYFFSAAASLPIEVERRWREKFGTLIYQGYGLTETSPFASYNHQVKHKPGSIGTPIEGVEMRIVDPDDGTEVAAGAKGEILIRGDNVMLGYWNRPEETARVLRNGWFHTGDIGCMDEEGYFFIEDRVKDMINVGGFKVYPAEVENAIYRHPAVAEAAVFGAPDALLGERVVASLVAKTGAPPAAEEIMAFCRRHLADYKLPAAIAWVAALPKNPTGKILKRVLRENYKQELTAAGEPEQDDSSVHARRAALPPPERSSAEAIASWLLDWLAGHLGLDRRNIDTGMAFAVYGVDSLAIVRMTQDIGQWLSFPVNPAIAWRHPDVAALALALAAKVQPPVSAAQLPDDAATDRAELASRPLTNLSDDEIADLLEREIAAARRGESE